MSCLSCASENQAKFTAEMIIHFSGLRFIDNPGVWAFPKISACLDCGVAQFTLPETELRLLREPNGVIKTSVAEGVGFVRPGVKL